MKETDCKNLKLNKGEMNVYNFGEIKLHAYNTKDFLADEVFIVEKAGKGVVIESPCFYDNIKELENYIKENNLEIEGVLVSYHASGATFLPEVKKYATEHADVYGHVGGGKALIDSFEKSFGKIFDSSIHTTTDFLSGGKNILAGIEFDIIDTQEGYDIVIPEINVIYTHMLGHDCHPIVAGEAHADTMIATLEGYINKGYEMVLTSHYTPEDLKDVETKIAYLKELKVLAKNSYSVQEFKDKTNEKYPNYSGANYLDMTANFFFKN